MIEQYDAYRSTAKRRKAADTGYHGITFTPKGDRYIVRSPAPGAGYIGTFDTLLQALKARARYPSPAAKTPAADTVKLWSVWNNG